jgi:hypothetical protein
VSTLTACAPVPTGLVQQITKDSDSGVVLLRGLLQRTAERGKPTENGVMAERTCAACDCKLDADPIEVKIGGRTVEVCCEDCARQLNEAQLSVAAPVSVHTG